MPTAVESQMRPELRSVIAAGVQPTITEPAALVESKA